MKTPAISYAVAAAFAALPCFGADAPTDLYLLIGQSNMKGRGDVPETQDLDPNILVLGPNGQWREAREPLHAKGQTDQIDGVDNAGVGPGMSFARAMLAAHPGRTIGLIPCAVGGSWIDLWAPGHKRSLYDKSLAVTKAALEAAPGGKLRGVLWLQGESDSTDDRFPVYEEKLHTLVDNLRRDFAEPNLPFVACTIGSFIEPHPKFNRTREINEILLRLPENRPNTITIDARDVTGHIGDRLHFNTPAQEEIGRRFAEAMLEITK